MNYCIVTTYYCNGCLIPQKEYVKQKLNFDGDVNKILINFSNSFDPWNLSNIPYIGNSKRRDLVYGKIFMLKKFIEDNVLNKFEYLIHLDYSDTKFCLSAEEMMSKFIKSDKEIMISTEKICWPYLEIVSSWIKRNLNDIEFEYLNSGAVISKTKKFYEIISKLEKICLEENIDFWDDQGVWQYYDLRYENIDKDKNCDYFFSTALLDESYYSLINGKIKTKFETYPFLIHDNSSFSLNLTKKI